MVVYDKIIVDGVEYNHAHSDDGFVISDEEGDYEEAFWGVDTNRSFSETDRKIMNWKPMKYSRWGIIKALEKRGLADAFDAYLDANKAAFRRFYGPNYFAADDADFKAMLTTLQGAFKLTDADIADILTESPYTDD